MARIAYILLCHKDPDAIIEQANRLTTAGDYISIHFDARARKEHYQKIRTALSDNPNVTFAARRVKCGWGEWSLVQASLNAIRAAVEAFPRATHFYMLSGDCISIKSAEFIHRFLDSRDVDYIESVDFFDSGWIKTGMKEERLTLRHFVNERKHKSLFYASVRFQRWAKLHRKIPHDLEMMIGSQWWCLRRRTIEWVLRFCRERPDVVRFFTTSWIPDETFFQTLVRHLVPEKEIENRTLTFLMFSDYGIPVTFFSDHYDLLLSQDFLFARKVSPDATELKARLGDLYNSGRTDFALSNEGRRLYGFIMDRGRVGRRFAPRFWETEATMSREKILYILTCKKWHVAKRLLAQVQKATNMPGVEYLFDEGSTHLPDLGGIQNSLEKRARHRRALIRMLFDYYETDHLMICLDPKNLAMIHDFYADRCTSKMLNIECEFSDEFLIGHARRVGLASDHTTPETLDRLLPTLRYDVSFENDQIRDAGFAHNFKLTETGTRTDNVAAISAFFSINEDKAAEVMSLEHLFSD